MKKTKRIASLCVLALGVSVVAAGAAQATPAKEQGSTQGQPFKTVRQEIAEELESQIAAIEERIGDSEGDLEQLEADLAALEFELDLLQGTISEAQCPPGEVLVGLDPTTCRPEANDQLLPTTVLSSYFSVPAHTNKNGVATCPEGYIATGCGYRVAPSAEMYVYDMRTAGQVCYVAARNNADVTGGYYARVTCAIADPAP